MTGYEVEFLGCKISHTDAQCIEDALLAAGHARGADAAAIGVVNTCCITGEAERKSRQRIGRMLGGMAQDGRLFVTGCGASHAPEQYARLDERVTVLAGAAPLAAHAIVEAADALAGLACHGPLPGVAPGHEPGAPGRRTRAFVKVQDGCDFDCSYCIVPAVRGAPRSRPLAAIVGEVERRVARGQREIVLTGVNIGLHRDPDTRTGLDRLLLAVADVDGVDRVRISSIEVNHVSRRLVAAMASHPKVCPHLHVPLQSGDDAVLRDMGRHYDTRRFAQAIARARAELPTLNLTTDIIVGYPSEDDAAFEQTMAFAAEQRFTKVHAFPFSERPGTDAASHRDPIARAVKAVRSARLRAQAEAIAREHRATLVGTRDEVVVETRRGGAQLTEDPASRAPDLASADRPDASTRVGYTRDYSPVRLVDVPQTIANGHLAVVAIEALDAATGVLEARYLAPAGVR